MLDEKLGRYDDAAALLTQMLSERESSWIVGTYERPRYGPRRWGSGFAPSKRDRLHDRPAARACFDRLYRDFTTSELRDDALWEEARMLREDGDGPAACNRLAALVHDFPASRFVPCASALCTEITRPTKSGAPVACHPYIEQIRLGAEGASDPAKDVD